MKTQTFTPSSKNAGALGGKSYPLSPKARLQEPGIAIRSWVVQLIVSDSADKLDHTSRGVVLACSRGPLLPGEKTSLPQETLGGTGPEALAFKWGDSSRESGDRPVCSQVGSKLPRQSQGRDSPVCLDGGLGPGRDPP